MRTLTSSFLFFSLIACGGRSESATGGSGDGDGDSVSQSGGSGNGEADGDALGDGDSAGAGGTGALTSAGGSPSTGGSMNAGGTLVGTGGSEVGPFGEVEEFCSEACENVETFDQGCAEIYPCADVEEPTAWDGACWAQASRWPDEAREAFVWCIQNDPLCFVSSEGCMLDRLFGEDPATQLYIGADFSFPDGTLVGVATEVETIVSAIEGGEFAFSAEGLRWGDIPESAPVWLDANGNGTCDADADLFAVPQPQFNGNFEEPLFIAELTDDRFQTTGADFCADRF